MHPSRPGLLERRQGHKRIRKTPNGVALAITTLILALVIPGSAIAAVFNCPGGDVPCLISTINVANANGESDTILLEGTFTLSAADNEIFSPEGFGWGTNGLPSITTPIKIMGVGAAQAIIQRDPRLGTGPPHEIPSPFRILHVAESGTLKLEAVDIRNGALELLSDTGGGGILNFGVAELVDSAVTDNFVGAAIAGAGIQNYGTLSLVRTHVSGNEAIAVIAGGIWNLGTMNISHSSIVGNFATDGGGGIVNTGDAVIANSTIANNATSNFGGGGGISNGGTLEMLNTTVANNQAGPIFFQGGAGILVSSGTVRINSCTIAENTVRSDLEEPGGFGAGIHNEGGTVELRNAILAGNRVDRPTEPTFAADCAGSVTSLGHNLVEEPFGCTITLLASDLMEDPRLDSFQDDGRPGRGHFPLLEPSPAIDAGDHSFCTPTDQLGQARVDGDGDGTVICDIGAIEFAPRIDLSELLDLEPLVTGYDPLPVPGGPAGRFMIKAIFTNKGSIPIHDPIFKVTELSGGNLLLNADGGPGKAGASLTPDVGPDAVLSPDESFTAEFVIGLQERAPFDFFVHILGVPGS